MSRMLAGVTVDDELYQTGDMMLHRNLKTCRLKR